MHLTLGLILLNTCAVVVKWTALTKNALLTGNGALVAMDIPMHAAVKEIGTKSQNQRSLSQLPQTTIAMIARS